ncbi:MAG: fructosamine kinase family protein [Burkholderiales bacterium]|nr:fructosamine kinase family protein [Burkholderiales bacterium]
MPLWTTLSQHITDATGASFQARRQRSVGGGCINGAYIVEDGLQCYFVKTNTFDKAAMFAAEAAALQTILDSHTLRAPHPICHGVADGHAYLVLEFIEMGSHSAHSAALLGEQLAAMHHVTTTRFGWDIDNTIGATPQINTWRDNWIHFYGEQRLRFQLELAARNGYPMLAKGEKLIDHLPDFFTSYQPHAALLHGDLWGGNWGAGPQDNPVIFDPALYYGDRETDLAMTELFGGFPATFHAAYAAAFPLDKGYAIRKDLYNLYHILNHLNLFGSRYSDQSARLIDQLLAELRG